MNELEQFYEDLNNGDYDNRHNLEINSELLEVSKKLNEKNNLDTLYISELERQAFAIGKSFETIDDEEKGTLNGLSWRMSGTQTMEDGTTQPMYYPEVRNLTIKDFQYFEDRYKSCRNLYAKTEFGLLIYFGAKTVYSKHIDFKKSLFHSLFDLSQQYLEKAKSPSDKNFYILDYYTAFEKAFLIAYKSKLSDELNVIVESATKTHKEWDITKDGTLRVLLDLSNLTSEYFKFFKDKIDYHEIILKNMIGAKELENTHTWGAIYITNTTIGIAQKIGRDITDMLEYKAELYIKLSDDAEINGNIAAVSFSEDALRLYQQTNNKEKIEAVERKYSEQRGKFKLAAIRQELPQEHVDRVSKNIDDIISSSNPTQIIGYLILTPWYSKIKDIQLLANETKKRSVLMSMLGSSIMDKYGNTIDTFYTEDEKDIFNFWQSYSFNFQIGTQTMHQFFIKAYKSGKFNYNSTLAFLEQTWLNEPILRDYNGEKININPIDLIKPGIKRIFQELDAYFIDNSYELDYVTITDSLVLKVETLMRNFCEKIGIATFKTRQKGNDKLVMEKLLDDLLVDVKHSEINQTGFDEEDRIFIKYVLSEKAGLNLRNNVAHGLMDIEEYSFSNIILVLSIILKISKYTFIKK